MKVSCRVPGDEAFLFDLMFRQLCSYGVLSIGKSGRKDVVLKVGYVLTSCLCSLSSVISVLGLLACHVELSQLWNHQGFSQQV